MGDSRVGMRVPAPLIKIPSEKWWPEEAGAQKAGSEEAVAQEAAPEEAGAQGAASEEAGAQGAAKNWQSVICK